MRSLRWWRHRWPTLPWKCKLGFHKHPNLNVPGPYWGYGFKGKVDLFCRRCETTLKPVSLDDCPQNLREEVLGICAWVKEEAPEGDDQDRPSSPAD